MTDQPTAELREAFRRILRPFIDPDDDTMPAPDRDGGFMWHDVDRILDRLVAVPAVPVSSPPPDQTAEPVCMCGHPMRQHHEDVCLTKCGCQDGREPEAAGDLADRLEAALTARFTELGNPFSRMRIAFQGPDGWPASKGVSPHDVALVLRELLATGSSADDGTGLRLPNHTVNEEG